MSVLIKKMQEWTTLKLYLQLLFNVQEKNAIFLRKLTWTQQEGKWCAVRVAQTGEQMNVLHK
jgi:hypothetical protein